jgi:hypothetical protein
MIAIYEVTHVIGKTLSIKELESRSEPTKMGSHTYAIYTLEWTLPELVTKTGLDTYKSKDTPGMYYLTSEEALKNFLQTVICELTNELNVAKFELDKLEKK